MSEQAVKSKVIEALKTIQDPELKRDIVSLGMLKDVVVSGQKLNVTIEVTTNSPALQQSIRADILKRMEGMEGVSEVEVSFVKATPRSTGGNAKPPIPGIDHVIAVASGKGGVGKSTVSVNLAVALAKQGNRVGLMDGDIYGPNIPLMLGVPIDTKPTVNADEKIEPLEAHGIRMISMGVLVPPDQPMVWRGPMLHSAVTQFLQKVSWGELDYLLVDLPPGTGDVQLSLVQSVPLSGAVIVTTPQEVSLMDVRKGIAMFRKTNVPILGVIENMAGDVFGTGGGKKAAEDFETTFLGEIPLDRSIREGGDNGKPIVISNPESNPANGFLKASQTLVQNLASASNTV